MHDAVPSKGAYVDTAHGSHSDEPVPEYLPRGQTVGSDAPSSSVNDPAFTSKQLDCPVSSAYAPTEQVMQDPEPAPLYVPAGHATHSLAPAPLLEKPAAHVVHEELPASL